MVKAALAMIAALLVAGTLAAQGHDNNKEKTAKAEINIDAPLRVGTVTLPPGDYRIVCDRERITFTRTVDKKSFEFPCKGRELAKKSDVTMTATARDNQGVLYLTKLLLRGSIVEHVFQ